MADSAAKVNLKTSPRAGRSSYIIANGVTLYEGMLAGIEGGYLNHWADGAADVLAGIVLGGYGLADETILLGDTSATPKPEAYVDDSGVTLMHLDSVDGTPTQAKVGDLIYSLTSNPDDFDLVAATANNHPIGFMSRWRSATDVDVTLFTTAEMLAQATA